MRKIIGLAFFLIPLLAFGRELTIHFPKEGKYVLFLSNGVSNVYTVEGKDVVIDVPEGSFNIMASDEQNRGAIKPIGSKDNSLTFSDNDFNLIYKVEVKVTDSQGTPIDYAVVTLNDSKGVKRTSILREDDKGRCFFYFLPTGKTSVEAKRGGLRISQDIEISPKPEGISINLPFASLKLAKKEVPSEKKGKGKVTGQKKEEKPAPQGGINPFASAFLSFVIILAILYGIYVYLKKRGIDIVALIKQQAETAPASPSQPAPPSPIPTSPDICPYCGQKKDPITGACACTPGVAPSPKAAVTTTGQARLIGLEGAKAGEVFSISKETTIGRGEDRDIVVPDNAVSRKHCRIILEEDGYYIVDEGSTNGTFVGGMKVVREKLKNGDIIQIGESKFRFEL